MRQNQKQVNRFSLMYRRRDYSDRTSTGTTGASPGFLLDRPGRRAAMGGSQSGFNLLRDKDDCSHCHSLHPDRREESVRSHIPSSSRYLQSRMRHMHRTNT